MAALPVINRPGRADLVGVVGETTGVSAAKQLRDRMRADATGRMLLQDRPRVTVRHTELRCRVRSLSALLSRLNLDPKTSFQLWDGSMIHHVKYTVQGVDTRWSKR